MNDRQLVTISKFLSKHLRHQPEALGLTLAEGGWVDVDDLLAACGRHGFRLTRGQLDEVVRRNDKQRFAFDPSGRRIRANQGHSVEVDLQLEPVPPPSVLYHGTASANVWSILEKGLLRMSRHHVHLTAEVVTARKCGKRKGVPVVFTLDAPAMSGDGILFYRTANGVWLVEHVPPQYLRLM
jgi:putative RNA 2'-phosphotransferase